MPHLSTAERRIVALVAACGFVLLAAGAASAHEEREVAGYSIEVGFIDEPVYVGQKSGLELIVRKGDTPVQGLEESLEAEVMYRDQTRELALATRVGQAGRYQSVFFPTAAGPYTFRIFGTIEGQPVDESFTSRPDGFSEVQELSGGQFPVQFPAQAELVADAEAGRNAESQVTLAVALGMAGLVAGLIALGLALAARLRSP